MFSILRYGLLESWRWNYFFLSELDTRFKLEKNLKKRVLWTISDSVWCDDLGSPTLVSVLGRTNLGEFRCSSTRRIENPLVWDQCGCHYYFLTMFYFIELKQVTIDAIINNQSKFFSNSATITKLYPHNMFCQLKDKGGFSLYLVYASAPLKLPPEGSLRT